MHTGRMRFKVGLRHTHSCWSADLCAGSKKGDQKSDPRVVVSSGRDGQWVVVVVVLLLLMVVAPCFAAVKLELELPDAASCTLRTASVLLAASIDVAPGSNAGASDLPMARQVLGPTWLYRQFKLLGCPDVPVVLSIYSSCGRSEVQ
ncbi:uncharacterized protein HMPREF1120_06007 [Exophiala dermatitidis NIH/UT8656]|uniref:Uncharacterized protein n=1 Tax=Exophiala dermatitidis (strain ATCC 34100 / CBS 525.76 / NIH/UT8656) TaxID=858893 RepID=H6C2X4_EXODN|nr:uncharacterized protein HMPREF1120_06007 [Exophiala dermatitidis NIH/UT8656]EHY57989.1 hypothetical protein HMPREF1120_06007 [Exophiala dermatitidis NIH/UT8656]